MRLLTSAPRDISQNVWDEALAKLSKPEGEVVRLRFGLDDESRRSVEEIARALRLSRERVRQIEAKTRNKLHNVLSEGKL